MYFTIAPNRTVTLSNLNPDASIAKDNTGVYTITVKNNPGAALPMTGGVGTSLFTAIGGLLSVTAGAILTIQKRRSA